MRNLIQWLIILILSAFLFLCDTDANADDTIFGITVEQRALDILTLMSQRLDEASGASGLEEVISIKAKVIVADVMEPDEIMEHIPQITFSIRIELFKAHPDLVRVNLTGSFGELQFMTTGDESLAVMPEEMIFADINIPQILSPEIMLKEDDGGLFAMLNLLGGIPFGSLIYQQPGEAGGADQEIGFTDELDPSDLHASVRYRGKIKTEAGMVHIVTINTSAMIPQKQYIKIWVLEDTLDLYQISIEDERGTEVFIVIDELDTEPVLSEEDFIIDTSGLAEVDEEDFMNMLALRMIMSPNVDGPVAVDLSASLHRVARTGVVTIYTNGFDSEDKEHELVCEVEYRSPMGTWTPVSVVEYAGLPPMGHWDAYFTPAGDAELGVYSFRTRYTNSLGNTSEWLEAQNMVMVMPAPPRVVRTMPITGEAGVQVLTEISVSFSKPMDKNSAEKAFSVTSKNGQRVSGSFTWEDDTLIFLPSSDLQYDTVYLARINGEAKDLDGVGLDGNYDMISDGIPYDDYLWTFTTLSAPPMLSFKPAEETVYVSDGFAVRIMAKHVQEMYKLALEVTYDPNILEVEKVDKASFASWRPRPKHIPEADLWQEPVIDNSAGTIAIACDGTRTNGVSGIGYIATVWFKALDKGTASVEFSEVSVVDLKGNPIQVKLQTAEIQVIEFHPKDANKDGVVNILDFVAIASEQDGVSQAPGLAQFALEQNFPNPFNPETWIPYQLAQPSHVTIRIYRSTGEIVRTLDLSYKEAGFYTDSTKAAHWDGRDNAGQKVGSGVYFYSIQADGFTATRKMLLCK